MVKCINSSCSFTGPQGDFYKHLCLFRPVKCHSQFCDWKGVVGDRDAHTAVCPLKETVYTRIGCGMVYMKRLSENHDQLCKFFSCTQSYNKKKRCSFIGTRKQVVIEHAPYCIWLHSKIDELEKNQIKLPQIALLPQIAAPPQIAPPRIVKLLDRLPQIEIPDHINTSILSTTTNHFEFDKRAGYLPMMKPQARGVVAQAKAPVQVKAPAVVEESLAKKRSAVIAFSPDLPEEGPIASTSKLLTPRNIALVAALSSIRQRTPLLPLPLIGEASGSGTSVKRARFDVLDEESNLTERKVFPKNL